MRRSNFLNIVFLPGLILLWIVLMAGRQQAWAQPQPGTNMQQRLEQIIGVLAKAQDCAVAEAVIDNGMEILYGGLRTLPTKGELIEQTTAAHEMLNKMELQFAAALKNYVNSGNCPEQRARALDLALFVEQMNEVAAAVAAVTSKCAEGDKLSEAPCNELQPLLDELTGHELPLDQSTKVIKRRYWVKLRGPRIGPWIPGIEEDVITTAPIPLNNCVVVFKEFKGLMVRLILDRIIVVTDPWATPAIPRGTKIPVWRLDWVFSEYVKEWNICNRQGKIETTVTQRVKQDLPLNWFWRYYRKGH